MVDTPRSKIALSYRKKALYGLLVTCVFFFAAEGLLAVLGFRTILSVRDPFVGFESSVPLFVEEVDNDGVYLKTATNKLSFFNVQRFPKTKGDNSYRIFCLGGSTTYGRPYNDSTSYVAWLREMLRIAAPDRQWEVINAGGISYASYRVAAVLDELCNYSPDLFIVYTGHNEFLEERTYRDLRRGPKGLQRATTWLHHTRTFSLLHGLLSSDTPRTDTRYMLPGEVDTILDHAVGPIDYHRNEELRWDILEHFEFNLSRMVETARSAGADIMFVTPAANLKDFSPFKSEHRTGLDDAQQRRWFELFSAATVAAREGNATVALHNLERAAEIDDRRADLHYQIGRLQLVQEQYAKAHDEFLRAIDEDVCPLRAVPDILVRIERIALAQKVPLLDFNSILQNDCLRSYGHNSPGNEYFLDHVHPTIDAHRLLAIAIVEAMIRNGLVVPNQLWREEAIASVSRLIESRIDPELQSRALTNLAQVLSWAGKQEEAGPIAMQAVRLRSEQGLPADPESQFYAAVYLAMTGLDDQAIRLLKQVVERAPKHVEARWRLATLLYDQMKYDESKVHFVEAVRLDPSDASLHHMLGMVSLELGQYEEALLSLRRASELEPDNPSIQDDLALALQQLGSD